MPKCLGVRHSNPNGNGLFPGIKYFTASIPSDFEILHSSKRDHERIK